MNLGVRVPGEEIIAVRGSCTTYEGIKKLSTLLEESTTWFDGKLHLTPEQEDALEWAKEFMNAYERKRVNNYERKECYTC